MIMPLLTAGGTLRRSFALVVSLLGLAVAPIAPAATFAVIAGVDDYPPGHRLGSCVNDANAIARFLTDVARIPATNITVLLDSQATGKEIEKAVSVRFGKATAKDEVFFFFSGHGTLIPNWKRTSKVMKALVPHGVSPAPENLPLLLTQERLREILLKTRASRVVVVLDACHSGTLTRSASVKPAHKMKVMDFGWGAAEPLLNEPESNPSVSQFVTRGTGPDVTWLGACRSNQVSYMGAPMSEFTTHLMAQLWAEPGASVADFFPELSRKVELATTGRMSRGVQVPDAEGVLDRPLLAALTGAIPVSPPPVPQTPAPAPPPAVAAAPAAPAAPAPAQVRGERYEFELAVELNKPAFVKDEQLVVTVQPAKDCFLRLYLINADIKTQQIFPNDFQKDNLIKAGQKVRVPSEQAGFQFTMEGPWGNETIVAVASSEQFTDLVKPVYRDGLFALGDETPGGTLTRGIRVELKPGAPATGKSPAVPPATEPKVSIRKVYYEVKETRNP